MTPRTGIRSRTRRRISGGAAALFYLFFACNAVLSFVQAASGPTQAHAVCAMKTCGCPDDTKRAGRCCCFPDATPRMPSCHAGKSDSPKPEQNGEAEFYVASVLCAGIPDAAASAAPRLPAHLKADAPAPIAGIFSAIRLTKPAALPADYVPGPPAKIPLIFS